MTENYYVKAAGFGACLTVPLLPPLGYAIGTHWLTPFVVFLVFPVMGLIIGDDRSRPSQQADHKGVLSGYYYLLPLVYIPLWLGCLAWGADVAQSDRLSGVQLGGLLFSLAITSAFTTCVAHELMHRPAAFDRAIARIALAVCGYGHLVLEHHHHHATVGDSEIGGTPNRGEASYKFVVRNVSQGVKNALCIERRRLRERDLPFWCNRVFLDYALAAVVALTFGAIWGVAGIAVFLAQAAFAVFAMEMITYIQHYGLYRNPTSEIGPEHAWAHNCWLTNCLTLNIAHHSDHHIDCRTPYYRLTPHPAAPRLPACYFVMFVVALIPPLWRWVMDARAARLNPAAT